VPRESATYRAQLCDADRCSADALRASIKKFGLKLRSEKEWAFDADMRRNAAQEVPLFTQELKDHDVLLVADEIGDFGRYIAFNTWDATPIAGSEGLSPRTWSAVVEQWGASQLQSRFEKSAERDMRSQGSPAVLSHLEWPTAPTCAAGPSSCIGGHGPARRVLAPGE